MNRGVACSDSNPGSASQPLCTVQAGLDRIAAAGDAVVIHEGVYAECATFSRSATIGTATNPVVIKGADGERAAYIVIDASSLTSATCVARGTSCDTAARRAALTLKGNWSTSLSYVRVQNLTVRPPSVDSVQKINGVDVQCAHHIEFLGIRSDSHPALSDTDATAEVADGIFNIYNSSNILIQDCDISRGGSIAPGFQAVVLQSAGPDVTIAGCSVRDLDGGFLCESGGSSGVTAVFNDVAHVNSTCDGENVIQVYNVDNVRVSYNRITDHLGWVARLRSYTSSSRHPKAIFAGNTLRPRGSGQTAFDFGYAGDIDQVRLAIFKNNLLENYSTAFRFLSTGRIADCAFREDYDGFYGVTTPISNASSCSYTIGAHTRTLATDPTNAADCPNSGSAVIDGGNPRTAIPDNGGSAPDIGGCESGESAGAWVTPYDFKVQDTTSSTTPRITWDGADDSHVNLKDLDFKEFLKGAAQTSYECQVDSAPTFNSRGIGLPLWSSGQVSSGAAYCTVGATLSAGEYFARVRLNGEMWSDFFKFSVSGAPASPVCGNGVRETGETCDGVDLGGQTCASQGLGSGTLSCSGDCTQFVTSGCSGTTPAAAAPALLFLDAASAPVGSFLEIHGLDFGSAAGRVWFGAVQATDVLSWSADRIVVRVPAGAGSPVTVEDASGARSGGAAFQVHSGGTRWVSKAGADANACTESQPCLTIDRAKNVAQAGDVVLVRAGTYCENTSTNVGLYVRSSNSGTASQPITYRGYPGETVTISCCGTCGGSALYLEGSYVQVANLRMTGARGSGAVILGDNDRIAGCEMHGNNPSGYAATSGSGINIQNSADGAKVLGCSVHDNGSVDNLDHGMYLKGTGMEVAFNEIYNHALGYGIQLYDSSATYGGAKVHGNTVYSNRNAGITVNQGAVDAEIYNNVVRGNTRNGVVVAGSTNSPVRTRIYNNTIDGNDTGGDGYYAIRLTTGTDASVKNNVVTAAGGRMLQKDSAAGIAAIDSNQYGSGGTAAFSWNGTVTDFAGWRSASGQDAHSAVGDPLYSAAASYDYHLQAGSPALDVADGTLAPPLDHDGVVRPQGAGTDRGAFERLQGGSPEEGEQPANVTGLGRSDQR